MQASFDAREAALVETERLRAENGNLVRVLMQTKEREIKRMNEINEEHALMVRAWLQGSSTGSRRCGRAWAGRARLEGGHAGGHAHSL